MESSGVDFDYGTTIDEFHAESCEFVSALTKFPQHKDVIRDWLL